MKNFSVVFMGTPEFAVAILDKLYNNGVTIKAVVTAPDKPAGRGQKLQESDVKKFAVEHNLNVLQPTNLKDEEFQNELKSLEADLFVVVAFRMLPEAVWSMPPKGTINLHASLLPNYRGAAPINWAIMNGEKQTGVTTFFIEKEIDTGKIIEREKIEIGEDETVGELYEKLMNLGAVVMLRTVRRIVEGDIIAIDQSELISDDIKPAPKIFKEDCRIDFTKSVQEVHDFCRGLSPYPAAWCELYDNTRNENRSFKILKTFKTSIASDKESLKADKEGLLFPCSDYYLRITELQPEGKRRMNYKEFQAGNDIATFSIIEK